MAFSVEVQGIKNGETIPVQYTCEGENYSPQLSVGDPPHGTKSLALIVEDPDAPVGLFVHWVAYNIDPAATMIRGRVEKEPRTKEGFLQGKNDFGRLGYDGPCPPKGHGFHRYFFRMYALNSTLGVEKSMTRERLLREMEGKVLGHAECMGRYQR